jgi:hypothetical protein
LLTPLVERLDRLTPGGTLIVVDLAQIEHVSLHSPTAGYAAVLDDAPVAVLLAVLPANLLAQKHSPRLPKPLAVSQDTWSAPQPLSVAARALIQRFSSGYQRADVKNS